MHESQRRAEGRRADPADSLIILNNNDIETRLASLASILRAAAVSVLKPDVIFSVPMSSPCHQ
jgi:hypothetical protein